jgi:hypothetical protein
MKHLILSKWLRYVEKEEKIQKNDFCAIYPDHKREILRVKKSKNRNAVFKTPGTSEI